MFHWFRKKTNYSFKPGTVVVFEPNNFNPEHWNNLSEEDRLKYYGSLGYGDIPGKKLFVFVCEVLDVDGGNSGHCVLISLDDQHVETMRHTSDFRKVTEEEF